MRDINEVWLTGRPTKNPQFRTTPNGNPVCDIKLAVNKSNPNDPATFVLVTCWGKQAEFVRDNVNMGDHISIRGAIADDNFERDGVKTYGRLKVDHAIVRLERKRVQPLKPSNV